MNALNALTKSTTDFIHVVNKHPTTQQVKRHLHFGYTYAALGVVGSVTTLAILAITDRPICLTALSVSSILKSNPNKVIGFCQTHPLNPNTLMEAVIAGALDSAYVAATLTCLSLLEKGAQKTAKIYGLHLKTMQVEFLKIAAYIALAINSPHAMLNGIGNAFIGDSVVTYIQSI